MTRRRPECESLHLTPAHTGVLHENVPSIALGQRPSKNCTYVLVNAASIDTDHLASVPMRVSLPRFGTAGNIFGGRLR